MKKRRALGFITVFLFLLKYVQMTDSQEYDYPQEDDEEFVEEEPPDIYGKASAREYAEYPESYHHVMDESDILPDVEKDNSPFHFANPIHPIGSSPTSSLYRPLGSNQEAQAKFVRLCKTRIADLIDPHSIPHPRRAQPTAIHTNNIKRGSARNPFSAPKTPPSSTPSNDQHFNGKNAQTKRIVIPIGRTEYEDCTFLPLVSSESDSSGVFYPDIVYILTNDGEYDEIVYNPHGSPSFFRKFNDFSPAFRTSPPPNFRGKHYSPTISSLKRSDYDRTHSSKFSTKLTKTVPIRMHEYVSQSVPTGRAYSTFTRTVTTRRNTYVSPKPTRKTPYLIPVDAKSSMKTSRSTSKPPRFTPSYAKITHRTLYLHPTSEISPYRGLYWTPKKGRSPRKTTRSYTSSTQKVSHLTPFNASPLRETPYLNSNYQTSTFRTIYTIPTFAKPTKKSSHSTAHYRSSTLKPSYFTSSQRNKTLYSHFNAKSTHRNPNLTPKTEISSSTRKASYLTPAYTKTLRKTPYLKKSTLGIIYFTPLYAKSTTKTSYTTARYTKVTPKPQYLTSNQIKITRRPLYSTFSSIKATRSPTYLNVTYLRLASKAPMHTKSIVTIPYLTSMSTILRSKTTNSPTMNSNSSHASSYTTSSSKYEASYFTPTYKRTTRTPYLIPTIARSTHISPYLIPSYKQVTPNSPHLTRSKQATSRSPNLTHSKQISLRTPYLTSNFKLATQKTPYFTSSSKQITPRTPYLIPISKQTTFRTPYLIRSKQTTLRTPYLTSSSKQATPRITYLIPISKQTTLETPFMTPSYVTPTPSSVYFTSDIKRPEIRFPYFTPSYSNPTTNPSYLIPKYTSLLIQTPHFKNIYSKLTVKTPYVTQRSTHRDHPTRSTPHRIPSKSATINTNNWSSRLKTTSRTPDLTTTYARSSKIYPHLNSSFMNLSERTTNLNYSPKASVHSSYFISNYTTQINNTSYFPFGYASTTFKTPNLIPKNAKTIKTHLSNGYTESTSKILYETSSSTVKAPYSIPTYQKVTTATPYLTRMDVKPIIKTLYPTQKPAISTARTSYFTRMYTSIRSTISPIKWYTTSMHSIPYHTIKTLNNKVTKQMKLTPSAQDYSTLTQSVSQPAFQLKTTETQKNHINSSPVPNITKLPLKASYNYSTSLHKPPRVCIHYQDKITHQSPSSEIYPPVTTIEYDDATKKIQQERHTETTISSPVHISSEKSNTKHLKDYNQPPFESSFMYSLSTHPPLYSPTLSQTAKPKQIRVPNSGTSYEFKVGTTRNYLSPTVSDVPESLHYYIGEHMNDKKPNSLTDTSSNPYTEGSNNPTKVFTSDNILSTKIVNESKKETRRKELVLKVVLNLNPENIPKASSTINTHKLDHHRGRENLNQMRPSANPYLSAQNRPPKILTAYPYSSSTTTYYARVPSRSGRYKYLRNNASKQSESGVGQKYQSFNPFNSRFSNKTIKIPSVTPYLHKSTPTLPSASLLYSDNEAFSKNNDTEDRHAETTKKPNVSTSKPRFELYIPKSNTKTMVQQSKSTLESRTLPAENDPYPTKSGTEHRKGELANIKTYPSTSMQLYKLYYSKPKISTVSPPSKATPPIPSRTILVEKHPYPRNNTKEYNRSESVNRNQHVSRSSSNLYNRQPKILTIPPSSTPTSLSRSRVRPFRKNPIPRNYTTRIRQSESHKKAQHLPVSGPSVYPRSNYTNRQSTKRGGPSSSFSAQRTMNHSQKTPDVKEIAFPVVINLPVDDSRLINVGTMNQPDSRNSKPTFGNRQHRFSGQRRTPKQIPRITKSVHHGRAATRTTVMSSVRMQQKYE